MTFATADTLNACGFFDQQAKELGFLRVEQAGAGSVQGDATLVLGKLVVATGASNTGFILPSSPKPGDSFIIVNNDANTIKVYPPSGGAINAVADNGAVTITTELARLFVCYVGGATPKYVSFVCA